MSIAREEYERSMAPYYVVSEFFMDAVVPGSRLRQELIQRFEYYSLKDVGGIERRNGVSPV